MSIGSCCAILIAPIWPIVSIILGLIAGTISSAIATIIVFFVALAHFPQNLWKTLSVSATTDECFKGIPGSLWRVPVLVLTPIGPILFLVLSPIICATFGTLLQIGTATGAVYGHDYEKAAKRTRANLSFDKDSILGDFLQQCKHMVNHDDFALETVHIIKVLYTLVLAFAFACLAFIPFSVAMAAVTVYRLPINFFKTMRIALFTVMLRWDLRIIVLCMLPLIHTIFPLIVLVVSMVGSFFWTWAETQVSLYKDKSPFQEWGQLTKAVVDYYDEHKRFVSKRCDPFDHPTGIPMGWNGQQYGLEIERLVRFQLNFLLCVALLLYQTPILLVATTAIVVIKYVPACLYLWREYFKDCICHSESNCLKVLSVWPFHVLAVVLIPVGAALFGSGFVIFALLAAYWDVMKVIFKDHASLCVCLSVPFVHIRRCDSYTAEYYVGNKSLRLFTKLCCPCSSVRNDEDESERNQSPSLRETLNADAYWDRFASQCVQSTAELLQNGFLDYDSIEGMDPSCVQSIPSVAVFTILMDSLQKEGLKQGDIYWKVDETVCPAKGRAQLDNIASLLWPMVLDVLYFMKKHNKALLNNQESQQIFAMQALLCDNHDSDESTEAIRKVLDLTSEKQKALNNQLRTKISRLVLAILRVRPFQERMEKIFEYKYEKPNKTVDDLEAQPLDDKASADETSPEKVETSPTPTSEENVGEHNKGSTIFSRLFWRN